MPAVRHRTASGDLSAMWEFDCVRRIIIVVFRQGSAPPLALEIDVCSVDATERKPGAYPIKRLDAESWQVLPARWKLRPTPHFADAPIHESMGTVSLVLTNAPSDVNAELMSL